MSVNADVLTHPSRYSAKSKIFVHLPEPVGRHLGEVLKTPFTLRQRVDKLFIFGDIMQINSDSVAVRNGPEIEPTVFRRKISFKCDLLTVRHGASQILIGKTGEFRRGVPKYLPQYVIAVAFKEFTSTIIGIAD